MNDAGSTRLAELSGNTEVKFALLIMLGTCAWILVVVMLNWLPVALIPTIYGLPLVLVLLLVLAIRLLRKATAPIPIVFGTVVILYIAGGSILDITATIMHTPDLESEANLIARALLDSGHSKRFVYAYGSLSQMLMLAVVCGLWLSLLRHRDILIASIGHQSSLWRFLKAATGAEHLTWRQWLIPLRLSELPRAYHSFWLTIVLLIGAEVDRWYLGLEWFNLVSSTRWIVLGAGMSASTIVYLGWLWRVTRRPQNLS